MSYHHKNLRPPLSWDDFIKQNGGWKPGLYERYVKYVQEWEHPTVKKTWLGKVRYQRPKHGFAWMDMRRIIIKQRIYNSGGWPRNHPDLMIDMISLFIHWAIDEGIIKEKYEVSKKEIDSFFVWYLQFLEWFDKALDGLDPVVEQITKAVPLLAPFAEFYQAAHKIYDFVRKVFPLEDIEENPFVEGSTTNFLQ